MIVQSDFDKIIDIERAELYLRCDGGVNSVKRGRNRAFTLIELLVVVAVIALLLSILSPALNKVKEQAKRLICAARLKSVTTGIFTYAAQQDGALPRSCFYGEEDNSKSIFAGASLDLISGTDSGIQADYDFPYFDHPWSSYMVYVIDMNAEFGRHVIQGPWGFAYLFEQKIIDEPQTFYCPSVPKNYYTEGNISYSYRYDAFIDGFGRWPWVNNAYWAIEWVGTSYYYAPYPKGGTTQTGHPLLARKVGDLGSGTIMGFDVIVAPDLLPHWKKKAGGVNAYYSDGHVEFRNNKDAFDYMFDERYWKSTMDNFNHHPDIFATFVKKLQQ